MYIVRRTLGFHKLSDAISLSQFQYGLITAEGRRLDYGCGIRRADTISQTLKELEQLGYITIQQNKAVNGANLSNSYTVAVEKVLAVVGEFYEGETAPETLETANITGQPEKSPYPERGDPTFKLGETSPQNETDNIIVLQNSVRNKNKRVLTGGAKISKSENNVSNPVNGQVEIDAVLLQETGFDAGNALRLALYAGQNGKEADYIANLISYSLKHAESSPLGLIKYLIEHGEARFLKRENRAKFLSTRRLLAEKLAGDLVQSNDVISIAHIPIEQPIPLTPAESKVPAKSHFRVIQADKDYNCGEVWSAAVSMVRGKLGNKSLAILMEQLTLSELVRAGNKIIARIELKQAWQRRLISQASQNQLEQALRAQLDSVCVIEFSAG
jgi:hypothetical protein